MRDGIWLVRRCGVLAEVSEPPPLPIRPFENAQIADYLRGPGQPTCVLFSHRSLRSAGSLGSASMAMADTPIGSAAWSARFGFARPN